MASAAGGGEVVNIVGGGQFPKITAKSTDDFEVGVTLGTGSFGRVRFATHKARSRLPPHTCWSWDLLYVGYDDSMGNQNLEEE